MLDVTTVLPWVQEQLRLGKVRPFQKTHNVFLQASKWATHCAQCAPSDLHPISQQVELRLHNFIGCGEPKHVALMYLFAVRGTTYLYVKLETSEARSVRHVKNAVLRYGFGKTGGNKSMPSRREDEAPNQALIELDKRLFAHDGLYNRTVRQ